MNYKSYELIQEFEAALAEVLIEKEHNLARRERLHKARLSIECDKTIDIESYKKAVQSALDIASKDLKR